MRARDAEAAVDAPVVPGVTVLAALGRGAQSVVYRVERDGVELAMKVQQRGLDGDRLAIAAFRREAGLLTLAGHSGLASVYEVGEAQGRPYLIMDLIEGGELADVLRTGPLAEERIITLGIEVADILAAVHRVGLVHRDIKPQNILLQPDGSARLIDLGLAAHSAADAADPPSGAGTLTYSAPEQIGVLKRPIDGRCDLYALGVVLFECAAGRPPFSSTDVSELLRMHATAPAPDLLALRPTLSVGLAQVIAMLLAKDPDDRYASSAGLITDLRALAGDRAAVPALGRHDAGPRGIELPLVDREPELAALTAMWGKVRAGTGALVTLSGAPGSGRSRLATEFTDDLARAGVPVLTAVCVEGAAPLVPLAGAVERYVGGVAGSRGPRSAEAAGWVRAAAGVAAPYLRRLAPSLAQMLNDAGDAPDDLGDGFVRAVAGFVTDLAGAAGGGVLVIDDVQWLDGATFRVLQHVASQLRAAPLLLLAIVGEGHGDGGDDGGADTAIGPRFAAGGAVDLRLRLRPMGRDALLEIMTSLAGGLALDPELLERVVARCGGSPLGAVVYLRAVLDAGLILPCWGRWKLDVEGLDHIDLPTSVMGLLQHRIDRLGERSRALLTAAAIVGPRITPSLPARIAGLGPGEALERLDKAVAHGLLDRDDGAFTFIHDRVRRALLEALTESSARDLHQQAADILDREGADGPRNRYALARHIMAGHPDRDLPRAFAACHAAGRSALDDQAAAEAVGFLRAAKRYAGGAPPDTLTAVDESLGTAYHLAGQLSDAYDALDDALRTAPDRLVRVRLLEQLARIHQASWRLDATLDTVRRGLVECGRPLPTNPVWLTITAVAMYVAGVFIERTGIGFGTADPIRTSRYRLLTALHNTGTQAAVRSLRPGLTLVLTLRSRYFAPRLGRSLEHVHAVSNFAAIVKLLTGRPNRRAFARAARLAARLGQPEGPVYVEYARRLVEIQTGQPDPAVEMAWLGQHGSLIVPAGHIDFPHSLCNRSLLRGRSDEALATYARGRTRMAADDLTAHPYGQTGLAASAAAGRLTDARTNLRLLDEDVPAFRDRGGRLSLLAACAALAVEQRELGEVFDRVAAEFAAMRVRPALMLPSLRLVYMSLAYGRLEQCRRSTDADRGQALEAAGRAVTQLRRASFGGGPGPQLRAHHRVARAHLRLLKGDPAGALDRLVSADRLLREQDVPLAAFEAARMRARALTELGRVDAAAAAAAGAIVLADRLGWPHRAEWVRGEFGIASNGHSRTTGDSVHSGPPDTDRRRLAALEQLSVTASRILDPGQLTRVALDETIKILNAERAYLFLTDGDQENLLPHIGRDAAGNDLDVLTDYGSTVLERVRQTHEPVIVTGTDEGAGSGSQSVVTHGLRSIIVAPLLFDGRLLGVVYLDSRVAKGMFTRSDVGILTAITNHIAAALETARAAQLAVAVRAAERERDVAEKLRRAMVELSGSLDPGDVLRRLHATLAHLLPNESSSLIRVGEEITTVVGDTTTGGHPVQIGASHAGEQILAVDVVTAGSGDTAPREPLIFGDLRSDGSWLTVPLRNRGKVVGAVVLTSATRDAYTPTEVQLAAALVGEGMVAYDNALLFAQVEAMAETDVLTSISNRRHFFTVAEHDVDQASGQQDLMTVVMLDIDHFKLINDSRGHRVGDQVIRRVAQRVRRTLRATDRFGRYGGEEFAILLNEAVPDVPELGERLRATVADAPVETDAGPLPVTVSVGIRVFDPAHESLQAALDRADAALYRAKQAGRNQVVVV